MGSQQEWLIKHGGQEWLINQKIFKKSKIKEYCKREGGGRHGEAGTRKKKRREGWPRRTRDAKLFISRFAP